MYDSGNPRLKIRQGAQLYPEETIVFEGEGWGVITGNEAQAAYASHKTCKDRGGEYGFGSYMSEYANETCRYCGEDVPAGIVALVKLYMYGEPTGGEI
jgi:hypothetical protein